MKKLIFIVACHLFTILGQVQAQSVTTYAFGVKGGMNLSHLIEKDAINKLLPSYVVGLTLEQRFSPRFSLAYELLYSRQGDMQHFTNTTDRFRTRYNYITLPINIRYRLKHYPFYISPGFQAGYLVSKQISYIPSHGVPAQSSNQEKKIDLGLSAGLGYRFGKHFFGEAKYYQSVGTILKPFLIYDPTTGAVVTQTTLDVRNEVFSLSLSYYPWAK